RSRITSRYVGENKPGLLCNISSKKTQVSFLEKHIENVREQEGVHVSDFPLWDVKGYCSCTDTQRKKCKEVKANYGSKKYFFIKIGDRYTPTRIMKPEEDPSQPDTLRVPEEHRIDFERDPEQNLMDLAGISTVPKKPLVDKTLVVSCILDEISHPFKVSKVALDIYSEDLIQDFLVREMLVRGWGSSGIGPIRQPGAARYIHVDLAETGDSAGFAMVYCDHFRKETVGEEGGRRDVLVPVIHTDLMLEIPPQEGGRIDFEKIRLFVFHLRGMGFKIAYVSYDGYQSSDSIQLLLKAGFKSGKVSVDKDDTCYVTLQQAMRGKRFKCYDYAPFIDNMLNLEHDRRGAKGKVDHTSGGRKDVSDAVAGSTWVCLKECAPEWTYEDRFASFSRAFKDRQPYEVTLDKRRDDVDRRFRGQTFHDGTLLRRR
ncbi:MAG: hypothetical protein ACXABY_01695, partial [Candidatus Thorarchaeota archaeon]